MLSFNSFFILSVAGCLVMQNRWYFHTYFRGAAVVIDGILRIFYFCHATFIVSYGHYATLLVRSLFDHISHAHRNSSLVHSRLLRSQISQSAEYGHGIFSWASQMSFAFIQLPLVVCRLKHGHGLLFTTI